MHKFISVITISGLVSIGIDSAHAADRSASKKNAATPKKTNSSKTYSIGIGKEKQLLEFQLPGIKPGEFKPAPEGILRLENTQILLNGFPGQPGITIFALSRTWMIGTIAGEPAAVLKQLGKIEHESEFKNDGGISGTVRVFPTPVPSHRNLEMLNPPPLITRGLQPLKQLPRSFVFQIARGDRHVAIMMVGAPPNDVKPEVMAKRLASSLRWKK